MEKEYDFIVFYDGDCGFCNTSVQFVLNHEKSDKVYFSAIQSDFTKTFFESKGYVQPDLTTFYYYKEGILYSKSTAALKLTAVLRFPYTLFQFFLILPAFLRNGVYSFVSKRRLSFVKGFCVVPSIENRKRFIN
jgi:predicted DCC family thiol-disulfide oxidoreductase YuxK